MADAASVQAGTQVRRSRGIPERRLAWLMTAPSMALIMATAFKGQGLLRTVVLVPWAVLTVVTAIMWKTIVDPNLGFVNQIVGGNTVWLGEEPHALIVMII